MNVTFFGKVDSRLSVSRVTFYMDDYLDSCNTMARNHEGVKCYKCPSQRKSLSKSMDVQ